MSKGKKSDTPKWILIGTGLLGLLAGALVLVVRYYEISKARSEAEQARIGVGKAQAEAELPKKPGAENDRSAADERPKTSMLPETWP